MVYRFGVYHVTHEPLCGSTQEDLSGQYWLPDEFLAPRGYRGKETYMRIELGCRGGKLHVRRCTIVIKDILHSAETVHCIWFSKVSPCDRSCENFETVGAAVAFVLPQKHLPLGRP